MCFVEIIRANNSAMSSQPKSRWVNTKDDAELDATIKRERQYRRRKKQERNQHLDTTAQLKRQAGATQIRGDCLSKRRKFTQETSPNTTEHVACTNLLRPYTGTWSRSCSVENYDKLNDIEEGTYGWVARAKQRATGKIVALKRLKLDSNDRSGLPVTGLREIQILRTCKHRNIVQLEEVVVSDEITKLDNSIYLVLEFVEHDLKGILDEMPEPFLASEVKCLLKQLTSGVAYLHECWILHRDLKTSNLLLNNRGQLKIADFGMARCVGEPSPTLTQLVVTLWYRAPELLLGAKAYNSAIDLWSIGCIFGELTTREPLLQGQNEVDQVSKIFELCGVPTENTWPGFRRLPNGRNLLLPKLALKNGPSIRAKFSNMTSSGVRLLSDLLSLCPDQRPTAQEVLRHEYFYQDPKPKPESIFPTFPSKAGQERRRRHEPHAPVRGQAVELGNVDFNSIFDGRDNEQRGAGFALRMV